MADNYSVKINLQTLLADQGLKDLEQGLTRAAQTGRQQVKGLTESFGMLGSAVKNVLASLAAYASIQGFKSLASSVIKTGAEFEQMMLKVRASTSATEEEFEKLNAVAIKLGAETEFSATQASEALNYLTMAGLDVEQAIAALPNTMNLATAGVIGMGEAADITTGILFGMGLQVEDLERVNDILVKTFTSSNQSITDLGNAFKYAGPVAKSLGIDMETVAVLMGELANAGIKGEMAGTALRSAFLDTSKVFAQYGVSLKDAEGNTRGLIEAMQLLIDKGAAPEQVVKLFGERAGPAVLALMDSLRQDSQTLSKQIADMYASAAGSTEKAAGTIRDSFKVALDEVEGALESIKIELFQENQEALKEALSSLAQAIRSSSKELKAWGQNLMDAAKMMINLAAAAVDVAKWFQESTTGTLLLHGAMGLLAGVVTTKLITGLIAYVRHLGQTLMAHMALARQQQAQAAADSALAVRTSRLTVLIAQLNAQLKAGTITTAGYNNQLQFLTVQYGAASVAAAKMAAANKAAAASALTLRGAVSGLYAMIGGPAGLLIIGITAAVMAYSSWKDGINAAREALEEQNRVMESSVSSMKRYTSELAKAAAEMKALESKDATPENVQQRQELVKRMQKIVVSATGDESFSNQFRNLGQSATLEDFEREVRRLLTEYQKTTSNILTNAVDEMDKEIVMKRFWGHLLVFNKNEVENEVANFFTSETDKIVQDTESKVAQYRNLLGEMVQYNVIALEDAEHMFRAYIVNLKAMFADKDLYSIFDANFFEQYAGGVAEYLGSAEEATEEFAARATENLTRVDNALALSFQNIRLSAEGMSGLTFFDVTQIALQAEKAGKTITDEVAKWKDAINDQIQTIEYKLNVEGITPEDRLQLESQLQDLHTSLEVLEREHQAALVELNADTAAKIAVFQEEQRRGVELAEQEKTALYKETALAFLAAEEEKEKAAIQSAINAEKQVIASCQSIIDMYYKMYQAGLVAVQVLNAVVTGQQALQEGAEGNVEGLEKRMQQVGETFANLRKNVEGMERPAGSGGGGGGGGGAREEAKDESADLARIAADRARWEAEQAADAIKEAFKRGDADITQFLADTIEARKQLYDAEVSAAQAAAAQAASGSAAEQARAQLELDKAIASGAKATEEAYKEVFDAVLEAYNELISKIRSESEAIQLNVDMGFLSEAQGRDQIRALIEENEPALQGMLSAMEELKTSAEAAGLSMDFTGPLTSSQSALQQLKTPLNEIANNINGVIRNSITGMLGDIAAGSVTLGEALRQFLLNIAQGLAQIAAQQIASSLLSAIGGGAGGGIGGFLSGIFSAFAEGGPVRGPGTSTSDSIIARLSNGEFVINAKAVRFWGVGLFDQLNRLMSFDPSYLLKGYAEGGYVGGSAAVGNTIINNAKNLNKVINMAEPGKLKVDLGVKAEVDKDNLIKVIIDDPKFSQGVQKSNTREKRNLVSILGD